MPRPRHGTLRQICRKRAIGDDAPGQEAEDPDDDTRDEDNVENDHDGRHFSGDPLSSDRVC
jgi:hypothetical protein